MEEARQRALTLMAQRDQLESQIKEQQAILTQNTSTLSSPLVDAEGFPRADIDVYSVRLARVRVIELTNDVKAVMEDIRVALEDMHSATSNSHATADQTSSTSTASQPHSLNGNVAGGGNGASANGILSAPNRPFARVDGVAPGSPASEAGLVREDLVVKFGSLTTDSFPNGNLQPLAPYVAQRENQPILVTVRRSQSPTSTTDGLETRDCELTLVPKKWSGRGLLGCHIVPVPS